MDLCILVPMAKRGRGAKRQLNVRFTDDDMALLLKCQELLGGLSQADALRQMMLIFLGKLPHLSPLREKFKSNER